MSLKSKIYSNYRERFYPRINHIRGAHRLKEFLKSQASKDLEEVKEDPNPIHQMEFDNLIILDGCRYDTYREITGETSYRISSGSCSREVVENNFSKNNWKDTVLITANPHFNQKLFRENTGKEIDEVFHTAFKVFETDWNDEEGTVLPEKITEKAITAEKLFPDKRKIIWYMQPHIPFINSDLDGDGYSIYFNTGGTTAWDLAKDGVYSDKQIRRAHQKNAELVINEIEEKLTPKLSGKTVITSDHGNLLGEKGLYGHPGYLKAEKLLKTPLEVINNPSK
jgi:hypothetical protein